MFQLTAARRRLGQQPRDAQRGYWFQLTAARRRLEASAKLSPSTNRSFNSQPPGGGWADQQPDPSALARVSTHSRPEAAGLL